MSIKETHPLVLPIDPNLNYRTEYIEGYIREIPITGVAKIWITSSQKLIGLPLIRLIDNSGNIEKFSSKDDLIGKRVIITKYYDNRKLIAWNAKFGDKFITCGESTKQEVDLER